jgi:hypothetical protein
MSLQRNEGSHDPPENRDRQMLRHTERKHLVDARNNPLGFSEKKEGEEF